MNTIQRRRAQDPHIALLIIIQHEPAAFLILQDILMFPAQPASLFRPIPQPGIDHTGTGGHQVDMAIQQTSQIRNMRISPTAASQRGNGLSIQLIRKHHRLDAERSRCAYGIRIAQIERGIDDRTSCGQRAIFSAHAGFSMHMDDVPFMKADVFPCLTQPLKQRFARSDDGLDPKLLAKAILCLVLHDGK